MTLTSVRVRPRLTEAQAEIRWRTLTAERLEPGGVIEYDARGLLPIQYLGIEFVDPTDAATVTIRSRSTPSAEWMLRHRALFYSLRESDGAIRRSPAPIAQTWHPHELVFLAQGAAP